MYQVQVGTAVSEEKYNVKLDLLLLLKVLVLNVQCTAWHKIYQINLQGSRLSCIHLFVQIRINQYNRYVPQSCVSLYLL